MRPDFIIRNQPKSGDEICDFCSSPDVWTAYDCADFPAFEGTLPAEALREMGKRAEVEGAIPESGEVHVNATSRGAWAACQTCADLIDTDRWHDLLDRSTDAYIKKYPTLRPIKNELKRKIRDFHLEFRHFMRKGK